MNPNLIVHIAKMTGVAGTENHLLALLPGLHAQGPDLRLIVLVEPGRPMDNYLAAMQDRGIPAETVLIHHDVEPALVGRLTARLRELRPAAVHTHLIHADWHGVMAARRAGVPRIFWSGHNDDPFRRRLPIRLIQAYLWQRVTAGIAISEAVRQFMIRMEMAPPRKTFTVRYGLDLGALPEAAQAVQARQALRAELGIPAEAPVVGSVCRLIAQKGLPHALEAFRQVLAQTPEAQYVILGEGPLRPALEAQIAALGLAGRVHLPGWRHDAARLMPAFDLFLMPSLWEGFGLVVLEAMAACLPVVASQVSALPEIVIPGETGCLVPPADANALAAAVQSLLQDSALRRRLGTAGRARLESTFSVARMVEETLAVYGRFGIGRPRSAGPCRTVLS